MLLLLSLSESVSKSMLVAIIDVRKRAIQKKAIFSFWEMDIFFAVLHFVVCLVSEEFNDRQHSTGNWSFPVLRARVSFRLVCALICHDEVFFSNSKTWPCSADLQLNTSLDECNTGSTK